MLGSLLQKGVLVFIDDILVYSCTLEKHVRLLRTVFQILWDNAMRIKQSKCTFVHNKLRYLGHVISGDGVQTDPSNIDKVK